MSNWYQSPYNNRYPKTKDHTTATAKDSKRVELPRGSVLQPIRRKYLPADSWINDMVWSETEHVACLTEQHGLILVLLKDVDFTT